MGVPREFKWEFWWEYPGPLTHWQGEGAERTEEWKHDRQCQCQVNIINNDYNEMIYWNYKFFNMFLM